MSRVAFRGTRSQGQGGLLANLEPIFAFLAGGSDSRVLVAALVAFTVFLSLAAPALAQSGDCDGHVFITQDSPSNVKETELWRADQSVWPLTLDFIAKLESPSGSPLAINNLGFNNIDGFLYGWQRKRQENRQIVRIDPADGTVTYLGRAGLPDEPFMAGDITPDGRKMYFAAVSNINNGVVDLYTVPLPVGPDPPEVGTVWGDGTPASADDRTQNVADWAVSPLDGRLYGVDREGDLAILDPTSYERTDRPLGLPSGEGYGAAWFDIDGTFFVYRNTAEADPNSGQVFEINIGDPLFPFMVQSDPLQSSSRRNDGAYCLSEGEIVDSPFVQGIWQDLATGSTTTLSGPSFPTTVLLQNNRDRDMTADVRVEFRVDDNIVLSNLGTFVLTPNENQSFIVELGNQGFDSALLLFSGQAFVRLMATDANGKEDQDSSVPAFFHLDGTDLVFYTEQELKTSFNAGDFRGVMPPTFIQVDNDGDSVETVSFGVARTLTNGELTGDPDED